MPSAILGNVAGAVVGGLMSDGGDQQQTASKEPWAPAAPWIKDNIKTGQDLQRYYQQNPFNPIQQTAYQNYFADQDNYRQSVAPQMNALAQRLMGSNYSRQGGAQAMPQGAAQAGGLLSPAMPATAPNTRAYGLLDFTQLNPFTATNGIPAAPAKPAGETDEERRRREEEAALLAYMQSERQGAGA